MNQDVENSYYLIVDWVLSLMQKSYKIEVNREGKYMIWKNERRLNIIVNHEFVNRIFEKKIYDHKSHMTTGPFILHNNGEIDYFCTIFYLVNGIQEYNVGTKRDKFNRYDYCQSLQSKYDCFEIDLVKKYVEDFIHLLDPNFVLSHEPTRVFVTHDIDSVYGSLKYDGLWALKSGNLGLMMKIILDTILKRPAWFNMDKVASLENEYDIKACYYWIVQNGRSRDGIRNGDYSIKSRKVADNKRIVEALGNISGLHKSTMSTSLKEERKALNNTVHNRFHFLKMDIAQDFVALEKSGIRTDSSFGYPEHMGFRNSFGLPFRPFSIYERRALDLLEIPLNIMDGMFSIRDEHSSKLAFQKITKFTDENKTNALLTILWHNSEMTNYAYKWSFDCYKRLLVYFYELGLKSILPEEILAKY